MLFSPLSILHSHFTSFNRCGQTMIIASFKYYKGVNDIKSIIIHPWAMVNGRRFLANVIVQRTLHTMFLFSQTIHFTTKLVALYIKFPKSDQMIWIVYSLDRGLYMMQLLLFLFRHVYYCCLVSLQMPVQLVFPSKQKRQNQNTIKS